MGIPGGYRRGDTKNFSAIQLSIRWRWDEPGSQRRDVKVQRRREQEAIDSLLAGVVLPGDARGRMTGVEHPVSKTEVSALNCV
jgi:hypothetical protein